MCQIRFLNLLFFVILSLLITIEAAPYPKSNTSTRIMHGTNAELGQFPYTVFVSKITKVCGGALYNERTVITAAHCVGSDMFVQAGQIKFGEGEQRNVCKTIKHPDGIDVAILQLCEPFELNDNIKPIELLDDDPTHYSEGYISGFGTNEFGGNMYERPLKYAIVDIISKSECFWSTFSMDDATFCARPGPYMASTCFGDSGGPLAIDKKLAGIVSFGTSSNCNGINGFVNVPKIRNFIEKNAA